MMKHKLVFTILCILITACANQIADRQMNTPQATSSSASQTVDNQLNAPQATKLPANYSPPVTHFPQQVNSPDDYMTALLEGELVLENGCLRIVGEYGTSELLVWRPGFSTRTENGVVQILDNTGIVLASVGDFVVVGGGEGSNVSFLDFVEPLPENCPGPYWIIGESIKKINKSSPPIRFPQLINTPDSFIERSIQGELTLANGCLRVVDENNGKSFLLIWHPKFSISEEQSDVQVIDNSTGQVVGSIGDFVVINGKATAKPTWMEFAEPLPENCPGPYWLVGDWVGKTDKP